MLALLEVLATTKMAVKRENGREKRCHPKGVKADLRRSQVKHLSSRIAVLDVEAWNMGSTCVVPLKHIVDLCKVLREARTRRVNINPTSPLSMKLRNTEDTFVTVKRDGENIQVDVSGENLLLISMIYLGTC
jgi:hypothetical protein